MKFREIEDNPMGYQILTDDDKPLAYVYNRGQAIDLCDHYNKMAKRQAPVTSIMLCEEGHHLEIKIPVEEIKDLI